MVLDLKADRTSSSWLASNQMRLWFSALAYLLLERVRRVGFKGTEWAAFPLQGVFRQAARRLAEGALE
jgi:hypothetical protein